MEKFSFKDMFCCVLATVLSVFCFTLPLIGIFRTISPPETVEKDGYIYHLQEEPPLYKQFYGQIYVLETEHEEVTPNE